MPPVRAFAPSARPSSRRPAHRCTTCVGHQLVSTSPCASRPRRISATVPGGAVQPEPSAPRDGPVPGSTGWRWRRDAGEQPQQDPGREPDQLLLAGGRQGPCRGCPGRWGRPGQGSGTSTRPRPGEGVASTRSASPVTGSRAATLSRRTSSRCTPSGRGCIGSGAGCGSASQVAHSVVPPARRWAAQPATTTSYDGAWPDVVDISCAASGSAGRRLRCPRRSPGCVRRG